MQNIIFIQERTAFPSYSKGRGKGSNMYTHSITYCEKLRMNLIITVHQTTYSIIKNTSKLYNSSCLLFPIFQNDWNK